MAINVHQIPTKDIQKLVEALTEIRDGGGDAADQESVADDVLFAVELAQDRRPSPGSAGLEE